MTPQGVQGYDPRTGAPVGDPVPVTSPQELTAVLRAAELAFPAWSGRPAADRAAALEAVAAALDGHAGELVALADEETALGVARLSGEVGRTTGQLHLFADVLRDGGYVRAVITRADPATGRPDLRKMLRPIGPVGVFAASNFPFAFSVPGGDTASALAAGCAVVIKGHEAHPRTSQLCADALRSAAETANVSADVVSLVLGRDAGTAIVIDPDVRAVGFTGSVAGGRALHDLASSRPAPIPFYGELGALIPSSSALLLPTTEQPRSQPGSPIPSLSASGSSARSLASRSSPQAVTATNSWRISPIK